MKTEKYFLGVVINVVLIGLITSTVNRHVEITMKKGLSFSVKDTSTVIGTVGSGTLFKLIFTIVIHFKYKLNMTGAVLTL